MKNFKYFPIFFLSLFSLSAIAQSTVKEDTLIVKGICGMCKERIEEAAFGKGVKFVSWNKVTDELSVAYRSDKTSITEIEDRILNAGHSTADQKAPEEAYARLPDCCRYEELGKH